MKKIDMNEINNKLLLDNPVDELKEIEQILNQKIKSLKTKDKIEKEKLFFLYLICHIKRNYIETQTTIELLKKYFEIINDYKKDINYKNNLVYQKTIHSHIRYIRKLYTNSYYSNMIEKIVKMDNEIKKDILLHEKQYTKYIYQLGYKYILGYGVGYFNLMYSTSVTLFVFAFLFFYYDAFVVPGTLIADFPGMEGLGTGSFEYYLYLSTLIISNLGANESLAVTGYLRFLFSVEQILGILFFGLFIFIVGKKI